MRATLRQVPLLRDNYAWIVVVEEEGGPRRAFVVDPAEAPPILERVTRDGLELEAVLSTHHHPDHVGGNLALVKATGCRVIGPARDAARIPGLTEGADVGGMVEVAGVSLRVLDVAAHTRGHVAYALDLPVDGVWREGHGGVSTRVPALANRPVLFVGDALFAAGCGRLFEGTPDDLARSLRTLAAEDPRALVACGHEYTAANLRFARHVHPADEAIARRTAMLEGEKGATGSSVPSTLAEELRTNPFVLALTAPDPVAAVFALRRAKDTFAG